MSKNIFDVESMTYILSDSINSLYIGRGLKALQSKKKDTTVFSGSKGNVVLTIGQKTAVIRTPKIRAP